MYRIAIPLLAAFVVACGGEPKPAARDPTIKWRQIFDKTPGALLRVVGTSANDVYIVGADGDGAGPILLHYNGERWKRIAVPGVTGDLWWVEYVAADELRMVGENGMVISYQPSTGSFINRSAPTTDVLFGVWGSAPNNSWYVGGQVGLNRGVIWRDDGEIAAPDPVPMATTSSAAIFKVYGFDGGKLWMVGQRGRTLYYDGATFTEHRAPINLPLMGIHGQRADRVFAVGGSSGGLVLLWDGEKWVDETPGRIPQMIGVWSTSDDDAYAVGFNGNMYQRTSAGWAKSADTLPTFRDLHAVWVDPDGGIWAVGGQLSANPPTEGVLIYYGPEIPTTIEP